MTNCGCVICTEKHRDEALAEIKAEWAETAPAARPMFCEHPDYMSQTYNLDPKHWDPQFARICAICGEELV